LALVLFVAVLKSALLLIQSDCSILPTVDEACVWGHEIALRFDSSIFVNVHVKMYARRLTVQRICIPGYTPEECEVGCSVVERVNAVTVAQSITRTGKIVETKSHYNCIIKEQQILY
jgi:hypothetical protein